MEANRAVELGRVADEWALEELRQALRRELRTHRGQEALARIIGVGRAVIRKLVEMRSVPRPEHLNRLREWAADRPAVEMHAGTVLLAMLVADLPAAERSRARRSLAAELARLHHEAGVEVPQWLASESADQRRAQ
ncbi:MAG TPA: hypothetical protein VHG28_13195 [Longimicrobiaceae bacterium]|nr:hypothetical protein [Longimicrobiaceae bacterium]